MLDLLMKNGKLRVWCSLINFFHVICKLSNFNMWTTKHFTSASCSELTLLQNLFQPIVCTVRSSMRRSVSFACIIYDSMGKESCYLKKCFVPLMSNTTYRVFGPLRHPSYWSALDFESVSFSTYISITSSS